jgi:hypothetical protein
MLFPLEVHFFASSGIKLNPNGVSTTSAPRVVYPGNSNLGLLVDDSLETCRNQTPTRPIYESDTRKKNIGAQKRGPNQGWPAVVSVYILILNAAPAACSACRVAMTWLPWSHFLA